MTISFTITIKRLRISLLSLLLLQSFYSQAEEAWVGDAQELLKKGKAKEAYELLAAHEEQQAGEIEFDYLLGVTALDAGKLSQATLAFERVIASDPNHAGARLDLARAYYAMGDLTRAKTEFQTVMGQNPPPAARKTVDQHLDAIEQQEKAALGAWNGYIEGSIGYDDNLTSVPSDFAQAVLTTFNYSGYQPTGNSIKREDTFYGIAAGAEYRQKINSQDTLFGGVEGRYRHYLKYHSYDSLSAGVYAGAERAMEQDQLRVSFSLQRNQQEGETDSTPRPHLDRNSRGLNGEWRHTVDPRNQAAIFAQYSQLRYPDIPNNDVNQSTLGGAWMHLFSATYQPMGAIMFYRTHENALYSLDNGSDYSKRITGIRLVGQLTLRDDLTAFGSLGRQWRNDNKEFARDTRTLGKDRLWEATLGLNWQIEPDWLLKPQLYVSRNTSNIPLYEYNRSELSISLRKDFR